MPGLEGAKSAIRAFVSEASGVHAVLFYGAVGAGKRNLADILAQGWLCLNGTGCGDCKACHSALRGANVDLHTVEPKGASAIIRIEAIIPRSAKPGEEPVLSIQEFLRTGPLLSRHKVVIIRDAHRISHGNANSLLKMLEEPPPYGRFILTTNEVGSLPATILSRCLAVACALPDSPTHEEPVWRLSGHAPHKAQVVAERLAAYLAIDELAAGLDRAPTSSALALAERLHSLADGLSDKDAPARVGNVESLDVFARSVAHHHPNRPDWTASAVEAHRRIRANAAAALTFDALLTSMLTGGTLAKATGTE